MALDSDSKKTLRQKVEDADLALSLKKRADNNTAWAEAHIELSEALLALADAEDSDDDALSHYNEAASGFEKALQVFTRKRNFSRWGGIIVSYVRCLRNYALREEGEIAILRLKRGLSLLDEVCRALPKKKGAFDRALILTEKGHVYRALSDIDFSRPREERLKLALQAFDEAIAILREKENFHYWSLAVSASALVAAQLARIEPVEKARDDLDLAIERFETALNYFDEDDQPQDISYVYFEMGRALMQRATMDTPANLGLMEKALKAFENSSATFKDDGSVHALSRLQNETALALALFAQQKDRDSAIELLEKSVALYRSNIDLLKDKSETLGLAMTYGNLGKDLTQLANFASVPSQELEKRYEAIAALRNAIGKEIKLARPLDWLSYFIELGAALQAASNIEVPERRGELLREAVKLYNEVLETIKGQQNAKLFNRILQWRALARARLGEDEKGHQGLIWLKQSELDFRLAIAKLDPDRDKNELFRLYSNLAHVLYSMARRKDSTTPVDLLKAANSAIETAFISIGNEPFDNVDEQLEAHSHHALVLWRLGSFGNVVEAFAKSRAIYEKLLLSPVLKNKPNKLSNIKRSYALMLKDWAQKVPKKAAKPLLEKAAGLVNELRVVALADDDKKALKRCDDALADIQSGIHALAKKRFFNFWPFNRI